MLVFFLSYPVQIRIVVGGVTSAFMVSVLVFAFVVGFASHTLTFVASEAFAVVFCAMVLFAMILATFLLASSAVGWIVLKRRGTSTANLVGLKKMAFIFAAVWLGTTFCGINRLLRWWGWWIFPEWYEFGLDYILAYSVVAISLLYFVFSATRSKYLARSSLAGQEVSLSQKPLLEGDAGSESKIPIAYEV